MASFFWLGILFSGCETHLQMVGHSWLSFSALSFESLSEITHTLKFLLVLVWEASHSVCVLHVSLSLTHTHLEYLSTHSILYHRISLIPSHAVIQPFPVAFCGKYSRSYKSKCVAYLIPDFKQLCISPGLFLIPDGLRCKHDNQQHRKSIKMHLQCSLILMSHTVLYCAIESISLSFWHFFLKQSEL